MKKTNDFKSGERVKVYAVSSDDNVGYKYVATVIETGKRSVLILLDDVWHDPTITGPANEKITIWIHYRNAIRINA